MFWKKPTTKHPQFGTLTYSNECWTSGEISTAAGVVIINIEGDKSGPSEASIAIAAKVLAQPQAVVTNAIAFAQANADAREFISGNGDITLDGFSFKSHHGSFQVNLALSNWPDAMIDVVFKDGVPCKVLLAD
jgi:hypothetical protein